MKAKQILAIIGIILLLALYASTLVAAIFDNPNTFYFLSASVAGTIIIPVVLWFAMMLLKRSEDTKKDNNTI